MARKFKIRVQLEAGTGEYIVVRYERHGWTVLFRGAQSEAHSFAQSYIHDARELAARD